jgi:hypothetical protein
VHGNGIPKFRNKAFRLSRGLNTTRNALVARAKRVYNPCLFGLFPAFGYQKLLQIAKRPSVSASFYKNLLGKNHPKST